MYGLVLLMPQFWQVVQNHSAQQTGMLLFPGGLATAAIMPLVGRLINVVDIRALIAAGMVLQAGAMSLFWVVAITAVVFAEKVLPRGWRTARLVGVSLLALGLAVALRPELARSLQSWPLR